MKTATQFRPYRPALKNVVRRPATLVRSGHGRCLATNADDIERRLGKVNAMIRLYQEVETICYTLLVISALGTVLYSASMFFHTLE